MPKHSPISRPLWQDSQKQILQCWRNKSLTDERKKDEQTYLPLLLKYAGDMPENGAVLEIGCGPVCLCQALPLANKTYLDPLLDDLRRMFPGALPEGEFLATIAERIPKPDNSFDLIVCLNTLSYALNPELIMNEMVRLLRPGGKLILAMRIHYPVEARLHYWTARYTPSLYYGAQPNYYSLSGIRKTLTRHFSITDEFICSSHFAWMPFIGPEKRLFVCTSPANKIESL